MWIWMKSIFGTRGIKVVIVVIILINFPWFGVCADIFGSTMVNLFAYAGVALPEVFKPLFGVLCVVLGSIIAICGPVAIKWANRIIVPLLLLDGVCVFVIAFTAVPISEIAAYQPDPSVVDGKTVVNIVRSVNETNGKLVLAKFLEWGADGNRNFAASNNWRSEVAKARKVIISEWEKFFKSNKDSHAMSIGKTKRAVQAMFDSLLFVKCENSDKNAVIASGDIVKAMLAFANKLKVSIDDSGEVIFSGSCLSNSTWAEMQMVALNLAISGKSIEIIYGDPEEEADATTVKTVAADADAEKK